MALFLTASFTIAMIMEFRIILKSDIAGSLKMSNQESDAGSSPKDSIGTK